MELKDLLTRENGYEAKLSGDQVKFIRTLLNESQEKFGRRFGVQQPVILRLEKKRGIVEQGPIIILIDALAKIYGIEVPDQPIRRTSVGAPAAAE